jgi:hypothetical protein
MSAGGSEARPGRLRDERVPGTPAARAGALIRAVPAPGPLTAAAQARVLAALGRSPWSFGALRLGRLLLPAATLLLIGASGFSAVAALEWMRQPRLAPAVAPPPAAPAMPAPRPALNAVAEAAPRPVVQVGIGSGALGRPRETAFARAQLAIDPHAPGHRPQVPAEFWRAHVGEHFTWKMKICVSPVGRVQNTTLLQHHHPVLDREVVRAVEQWRYHPARRNGKAVASCWNLVYQLTVAPSGA